MELNVLLFASYAEAVGAPSVAVTVRSGATVEDVLVVVQSMAGGRELPPALVAVNQVYARPGDLVNAGDEIAIIPPVAGG